MLFVEDASYHKSNLIKNHIKASKIYSNIFHRIRQSSMQIQWGEENGNAFFANKSEMEKHMQRRLDNGDVKVVNVFKYLMP